MSNLVIVLPKGKAAHISPILSFFERNPDYDPELIASELQHLRECLVLHAPGECSIKDIQGSYKLLTELMVTFREM